MSNRKRNLLTDLPEQCYAVMEGRLCIVTRGEKGWKRAPINAENNAANHELAVLKNKELGVTPEEVRLLVTGAVIGWDAWIAPKESRAAIHEVFEVEIGRPGTFGASTATTLMLPATPFEIADALDKARITDELTIYSTEVLNSKYTYLPQFIPDNANLYELNYLAQRLAALTGWELDCFKGMVMMDFEKIESKNIPLERLINFTHSTETCQLAHDVSNDEQLGKFYVDNGMSDIADTLPEFLYEILDYESIGRKARTGEGGVFTDKGYVVQSGVIAQIYRSGAAVPLEKPSHTITLEVRKGFFYDSDHDDELSAVLKLPCNDSDLDRAIDAVGAASEKECSFTTVDCRVSSLVELLNNAMDEDGMGGFQAACALADQLRRLEQKGGLITYKAMMEAAPKDLTLMETYDLSCQATDFSVMRKAASPADYAEAELSKYSFPLREELLASANLCAYGEKLMAQNLAVSTDYGILLAHDGMTVEQCLGRATAAEKIAAQVPFQ